MNIDNIENDFLNLEERIIIFEGIDRCGKSTQIELLKNHLESLNMNPIVVHYGRPQFGTLEYQYTYYTQEFYQYYLMLQNDNKMVLLLDRSFLGEYVWSKFRDYSGPEITKKLYETEIFQKIKNKCMYFLFLDEWEGFNERNDGQSLFEGYQEFHDVKDEFLNSFRYLNKLNYYPTQKIVNLKEYSTDRKKSIQQISKLIRDMI